MLPPRAYPSRGVCVCVSCHIGLLKVWVCFYSQQVLLKLSSIIEEQGMFARHKNPKLLTSHIFLLPPQRRRFHAFFLRLFYSFLSPESIRSLWNPKDAFVRLKSCRFRFVSWSVSGHVYLQCDSQSSRWAGVRDALIMSGSSRQRPASVSSAWEMMPDSVKLSIVIFDGL